MRQFKLGVVRTTMADDGADNVVHLGTGDLVAIGKALRDMYDFYVHSQPPDRIERLLAVINQTGTEPQAAEAPSDKTSSGVTPG
jgi:hypothetical protein